MKKVIAVLLICILTVVMAVPALAATTGAVGRYTPEFGSGERDVAYDLSVSVNVYTGQDIPAGELMGGGGTNPADATAWFLYDDDYLYIFVDVQDDDLVDIGTDAFNETDNPWRSDAAELWFLFDLDNPGEFVKYSAIAFGHGSWGQEGQDRMYGGEAENRGYAAVVTMRADGYTAEFRVPLARHGISEGDSFLFTLQLNNLTSDDEILVSGRQLQNTGETYYASVLTLGDPIVIAEPEPEEEEYVAGEEIEEVTAFVDTPAPQTNDASVFIMLALLATASAAFGVLKTSKRKI